MRFLWLVTLKKTDTPTQDTIAGSQMSNLTLSQTQQTTQKNFQKNPQSFDPTQSLNPPLNASSTNPESLVEQQTDKL